MAQYPIVSQEGVLEAVNYLASGPSGLGQNFQGFSSFEPAYLTGTIRSPYSISTTATTNPPSWYVAPIAISAVEQLNVINGKTPNLMWTFATPQAVPPFAIGQTIRGDSAWVPDYYIGNDGFVLTCSTTTVITQFTSPLTWPTPITNYGSIYVSNDGIQESTDANARVTVQGPTEIVFISSQLALQSGYSCSTTSTFEVSVQINRYTGEVDTSRQGSVDYLFNVVKTISEQKKNYTVEAGTSSVDTGQNIFTTVLDTPGFGYYWYICEIRWTAISGDVVPGPQTVGLRSLTAQVIKQ
jgi:hypothetical protein